MRLLLAYLTLGLSKGMAQRGEALKQAPYSSICINNTNRNI